MTYDEMSLKLYNEKKAAIYIADNNDLSFAGDVCTLISGKYLKASVIDNKLVLSPLDDFENCDLNNIIFNNVVDSLFSDFFWGYCCVKHVSGIVFRIVKSETGQISFVDEGLTMEEVNELIDDIAELPEPDSRMTDNLESISEIFRKGIFDVSTYIFDKDYINNVKKILSEYEVLKKNLSDSDMEHLDNIFLLFYLVEDIVGKNEFNVGLNLGTDLLNNIAR